MKILLLIAFFSFSAFLSLFSNWEKVSEFDIYVNCLYVSNNMLFAGTGDGILLSKDGGFKWERVFKPTPTNGHIYWITGNDDIIIAGERDGIHISHDKGQTWLKSKFKYSINYKHSIIIKNNYILVGSHEGLFRSLDYGKTWIEIGTEFDSKSINALFVKDDFIFAAPSDFYGRSVYRTSDNGITWHEMSNGLKDDNEMAEIDCFEKKDNMLYAGNKRAVFVSSDNGENWQIKSFYPNFPFPYLASVRSLIVIEKYIFLFYDFSANILISNNNFATYEFYNKGMPDSIASFRPICNAVKNEEYAYIVYGPPLTLYRMKISDISSVNNDIFSENQLNIYPNPAKTIVSIDFMVEPENLPNVSVELYNLTGILQSKLDYNVDYNDSNGQGTLNCNIENIPNGYYIIVIDNGKRKVAKPFIVNRN